MAIYGTPQNPMFEDGGETPVSFSIVSHTTVDWGGVSDFFVYLCSEIPQMAESSVTGTTIKTAR